MNKVEEQSPDFDKRVLNKIYVLRGCNIMLDEDLAAMYGVETRRLNEQVKRNSKRFPEDFMFSLSSNEYANLKSQNATSNWGGQAQYSQGFYRAGCGDVIKCFK